MSTMSALNRRLEALEAERNAPAVDDGTLPDGLGLRTEFLIERYAGIADYHGETDYAADLRALAPEFDAERVKRGIDEIEAACTIVEVYELRDRVYYSDGRGSMKPWVIVGQILHAYGDRNIAICGDYHCAHVPERGHLLTLVEEKQQFMRERDAYLLGDQPPSPADIEAAAKDTGVNPDRISRYIELKRELAGFRNEGGTA